MTFSRLYHALFLRLFSPVLVCLKIKYSTDRYKCNGQNRLAVTVTLELVCFHLYQVKLLDYLRFRKSDVNANFLESQ